MKAAAHTTSTFAAPVVQKTYVDAYAVNFAKLLDQSERVYRLLKGLQGKKSLDAQQQTKLKVLEADLASFCGQVGDAAQINRYRIKKGRVRSRPAKKAQCQQLG